MRKKNIFCWRLVGYLRTGTRYLYRPGREFTVACSDCCGTVRKKHEFWIGIWRSERHGNPLGCVPVHHDPIPGSVSDPDSV